MIRPTRVSKKLKQKDPNNIDRSTFIYYLAEAGDSPGLRQPTMLREPSLAPKGVRFCVKRYFYATRLERHRAAFQAAPGAGLHEHFQHRQRQSQVSTFFTNVRIRPIRAPLINARLALRIIRFLEDLWFAIAFLRPFCFHGLLCWSGLYAVFTTIVKRFCHHQTSLLFSGYNTFR